ncbi:MAG TPA: MarR family winged helix-turn-helix transcriptional regulator [Caulobacteraceae bacterium]|nr:MarR family winged helix-turn-helix transcriptional regulator [Caulobacteraceae bacterium]
MASPRHVIDPYPENSPDLEGEFALAAPEYVFYLLFQATRQRDIAFDKLLAVHDLNVACWRTLAIVRRVSGCTMKVLARLSAIDRTTLTRCVDQLVERGLIKREVPAKDRRKVCLRLTKAGGGVYDKAVLTLLDFNKANVRGVDPDKLREAARTLQAILRNILADDDLAADILSFGRPPPDGAQGKLK